MQDVLHNINPGYLDSLPTTASCRGVGRFVCVCVSSPWDSGDMINCPARTNRVQMHQRPRCHVLTGLSTLEETSSSLALWQQIKAGGGRLTWSTATDETLKCSFDVINKISHLVHETCLVIHFDLIDEPTPGMLHCCSVVHITINLNSSQLLRRTLSAGELWIH